MTDPAPQPAPNPPPKAAPPPPAPGLGELLEQSISAVYDPSTFARAALRPAPAFATTGGLALACGVAALAVNLAHAIVESPDALKLYDPLVVAAVAVAALGAYAGALLLLAALLHALGGALGGKAEFERGLQAAAMISVLAPVQMLCNWFPLAWIVPALLAAWTAAGALEGLYHARPGAARAACAGLAAAALALQLAGRVLIDRVGAAYAATRAVQEAAAPNAELLRSVAALSQQAQAMSAAAAPAGSPAIAAPTGASGLDLLRGPADQGGSPPPDATPGAVSLDAAQGAAAPAPITPAAAQAMQSNAAGMLDALTPMMDTLAASKTMSPAQKADIKELQGLMQDLKTQMNSGKRLSNEVFAQKMSRYQSLLLKVMSYSSPAGGAAPAPAVQPKSPKDGQ